MKGRISQRDIARLADVSPTTVSLALRGHPSLPTDTQERIRQIANENGYRPDPALSALNAYRISAKAAHFHGTLAWVTACERSQDWRKMPERLAYYRGASERADQLGYQLEEFWLGDPELSSQRASQILYSRNIRGLIVAALPPEQRQLTLNWEQFSAVSLGYFLAKPHVNVVKSHHTRNMTYLVRKLNDMGYRRIGMAMQYLNDKRTDYSFLGGFVAGQVDMPPDATRLQPALLEHYDKEPFLEWFQKEKPDVVIVSPTSVEKTIRWLMEIGLKVPQDVGVAGFSIPHDYENASGIDIDAPLIGRVAVDTVVGMIHRNEYGVPLKPSSHLVEGVWVEGKTVRPQTSVGQRAKRRATVGA